MQHAFQNYAAQRNWAIETLPLKYAWELHLDADERISAPLAAELAKLKSSEPPTDIHGYCVPRLVHFMRKPLRHGGMFPIWHMRLFRRGHGRCEEREYDQHFVVDGKIAKLQGPIVDDIRMPLGEWVIRHNRWSDAEVRELVSPTNVSGSRLRTSKATLSRENAISGMPTTGRRSFLRAGFLFFYRYIIRLGFLDGTEGLIFYFLQTFWFRFLIDAKLFELEMLKSQAVYGSFG